ncbi:MAG: hypothetical protein ACLRIS_11365 [Flavonifractor plautii]
MERTSWRRRARAFVPALLLLCAGRVDAPGRAGAGGGGRCSAGDRRGEPCPTVPAGQKLIALTFDDGPRRSTTTRLLDGLSGAG